MYGLILAGIKEAVVEKFGEEMWTNLITTLELPNFDFAIHEIYSDDIIPKVVDLLSETAELEQDTIMEFCGASFLRMLEKYGYTKLMKRMGRTLLDFLNGLDQLHDYMKFSYQKLKSPSFAVLHETKNGITLQYRSRRKGLRLEYYIKGFIGEMTLKIFNTKVKVDIMKKTDDEGINSNCFTMHDFSWVDMAVVLVSSNQRGNKTNKTAQKYKVNVIKEYS